MALENVANMGIPEQIVYEELIRTVECPTCKGHGRIRREHSELVALIPVRDDRLKPRRTTCYVLLAVVLCLLIAGLVLFFMIPRSVILLNDAPVLNHSFLQINTTKGYERVALTITNRYNISNENYFQVQIDELAVSTTFDNVVITSASNKTALTVPMRSVLETYISMNITFIGQEGYIANFCSDKRVWVHTLLMPFTATLTTSYLGHSEQSSLTTYQRVICGNSAA